jgi:carbon storage regulator
VLVLNRREAEKVIIANEIAIQVIRIGRDSVKLGIDAPSHIKVYRDEIRDNIAKDRPAEVKPQIPSRDILEAVSRVGELAKQLGVPTSQFLDELIQKFLAANPDTVQSESSLSNEHKN